MSASFAGSRSLDERRRRRIAADSEESRPPEPKGAAAPGRKRAKAFSRRNASRFPLRKLISPRLWKLWGIAVLALAVDSAVVWGSVYYAEYAERLGPGFARLFNPGSGRAMDFCTGLTLLLAGQLAALIWWVRSRSPEDFAGSYRTWRWMAGGSFLAAAAAFTEGHTVAGETILWMAPMEFAHAAVLCWMGPALVCGGMVAWGVRREMRGCRSSAALLWISALGWVWAAVAALRGPIAELPTEWNAGLVSAIVMFATLCLFTSLLLHARHVIYETADPPARSEGETGSRGLGVFRFLKRGNSAGEEPSPKSKAPQKSTAERKQTNGEKQGKNAPAAAAKVAVGGTEKSSAGNGSNAKPKPVEAAAAQPPELPTKKQDGTKLRVDMVRDKNSLKGLSKRERKLVRKQWREQERSAREDRE